MIIEWLYGVLTFIVGGFLALLPPLPDLSGVAASVGGALGTISSKAALFGQWIPLDQVAAGLAFIVAGLAAALLIKGIRIIASFFTAGGGSAA